MSVSVVTLADINKLGNVPCSIAKELEGLFTEICSQQGLAEKELRRRICKLVNHLNCKDNVIINETVDVTFLVPTFNEVENIECECPVSVIEYISKMIMENGRYRKLKSRESTRAFVEAIKRVLKPRVQLGEPKSRVVRKRNRNTLRFTVFVFPLYGVNYVSYVELNRVEDMVDLMIGLRSGYMIPPPKTGTYYPIGVVTYSALLCSTLSLLYELDVGKLINSRLDVWSKIRVKNCLECMLKKRYNAIRADVELVESEAKGFKKLVFYICSEYLREAQADVRKGRRNRRP